MFCFRQLFQKHAACTERCGNLNGCLMDSVIVKRIFVSRIIKTWYLKWQRWQVRLRTEPLEVKVSVGVYSDTSATATVRHATPSFPPHTILYSATSINDHGEPICVGLHACYNRLKDNITLENDDWFFTLFFYSHRQK